MILFRMHVPDVFQKSEFSKLVCVITKFLRSSNLQLQVQYQPVVFLYKIGVFSEIKVKLFVLSILCRYFMMKTVKMNIIPNVLS